MSMSDLHSEGVTDLTSYRLGVLAERDRIVKLLEQTKSPSHLWGGIGWAIALIKGEQK